MAINKVVYGNQVLIDITDSTVNPNTLLAGYKGYGADGNPVVGALQLSYHITLHQAQYDVLSESEQMADENWFYIDDAESIGAQLDDSAISPAKVWSSQKTNGEIQDVQDQVDINTTDIGTLNSAIAELSGRIKIEIGNVTTNISSGIANLRTDGKPIIYVTSGVDGWYYSLGRSGNIVWAKCFNYDGTVVSDRTGIAFYYYYLDNIT